jgi:endonuclease-3
MAVDTHVFRVSARLGLTVGAKTPLAAEKQLIRHIPPEQVHIAHHWLILHGRYTCMARQPQCSRCGLRAACKYFERMEKKTTISSTKKVPVSAEKKKNTGRIK